MAKEYKVGVEFSARDNASEKIKKIQNTFMKCEKMVQRGQAMQAFGQKMGLTSAVVGAAAVKANDFISSMKQPFMEVEESLLALRTVTTTTMGGMDKSMEMTKQKAIEWSKSHRDSAAQYIQTAYQMASAGLNDVQAIAATETAMRTARATMGDSADAAALIAVAYNNMGDKSKDAATEIGKFGDVIAKTQQLFQIKNLNQLSEGLKYAIPTALQFGQSFEEINVAVGALNNAGLVGGQAGTAYAAAMRQMTKASSELGFSLARNAQGGIDFIGTLANINQMYGSFEQMSPKVQEAFKKAFGDEGLRTISLLASKTADMQAKMKAVQNSKGTAAESQKIMESGEAAKLQIAAQRLEAIKINFAERLIKSDTVVKEIIPKMGQLVEKIADMTAGFMNAHPELAATVAVLLVGGAALMTLLAPLLMVGSAIVSLAGICVSGFGRAWKAATQFYGFIKGERVQGVFKSISQHAGDALGTVKEYFTTAKDAAHSFGKKIVEVGTNGWNNLKTVASDALGKVREYFTTAKDAAHSFGKKVMEAGKKAAIAAATGLKSAAKGLFNFARQATITAVTALPKLIAATWAWTVALLTNPITWIVLAIVAAVALLIYYWDDLKAVGIAAWNYLSEAAGSAWDSVTETVSGMIDSVVQFGETLWNTFAEAFPGVVSFIDSMRSTFERSGAALWEAFCNGIRSVLAKPAELVQEGLQMVRNLLPFSDAKEGPLSQLTRSGRAVMTTMAEGVPGGYGKLQDAVTSGFEGIDLHPDLPVNPDWNLEAATTIIPQVVMEPDWYIDPLASKMPRMQLPVEPDMGMGNVTASLRTPAQPDWVQEMFPSLPEREDWKIPEFRMVAPRERQTQQPVQIKQEGRKIIIYGDIHIQTQQMNDANDFMEALKVIADSEGDGDAD